MSYVKKYGKKLVYNIFEIVLLFFLITILYYFHIVGDNLFKLLKLIILLGSIFLNSFFLGKESLKKGYFEGMKYGMIFIIIFLISTLLFSKFQIKSLIYYFLIFATSVLGSMVGISKKKSN